MAGFIPAIHVLLPRSIQITASFAGLTRVSIDLRETLSKRMDSRVKPGYDAYFQSHVKGCVIARNASDEAIQFLLLGFLDCFAEPVLGRRETPIRVLAVTDGETDYLTDQSFTTRTAPRAALVAWAA